MKLDFSALENGFHFKNDFVDRILHTNFGNIETRGRCGGMAFAVLDYYFAKIPIPTHEPKDFPNNKVPPDGSSLGDYIFKRSINSLFTISALKFLDWSIKRQNNNNIRKSISYKTKHEEFPKLKSYIDRGKPVVLGLVCSLNIKDICNNHQVVAYGYDLDLKNKTIVIYIYDSNIPNKEILLEIDKDFNINESNGQRWNGFFVQDYHFKHPRYQDLIITRNNEISSLGKIYTIENIGQFPANLKYIKLTDIQNNNILLPKQKIIL